MSSNGCIWIEEIGEIGRYTDYLSKNNYSVEQIDRNMYCVWRYIDQWTGKVDHSAGWA